MGEAGATGKFTILIVDDLDLDRKLRHSPLGTRGSNRSPVDSSRALARALKNLKAAMEEAGATYTQGPPPTVVADESQLVQVFQNLVGNAVKFRGTQPPNVEVSAQKTGAEWTFAVRDNGIGIDPQFHERIFEIFQRLQGRKEYGGGAGIGLAICKKVVERHGGRIWVESEPGKGSTFFFTILGEATV